MSQTPDHIIKKAETHELKTWPEYFKAMKSGEKMFEIRKNDRGFNVGDTLLLKEWEPNGWSQVSPHERVGEYTGHELKVKVGYILDYNINFGMMPGYCILGLLPYEPKGLTEAINTEPMRKALEKIVAIPEEKIKSSRPNIYLEGINQGVEKCQEIAREALSLPTGDEGKEVWVKTADDLPPPATTLLGYNPKWIDEDFNPEGIRECFMNDDNSWNSAYWDNNQDTWWNDTETIPIHWMRRPPYLLRPTSTPKEDGAESVAFAEWVNSEGMTHRRSSDDDNDGKWYDYHSEGINRHYYTTDELYKLFKQKQ